MWMTLNKSVYKTAINTLGKFPRYHSVQNQAMNNTSGKLARKTVGKPTRRTNNILTPKNQPVKNTSVKIAGFTTVSTKTSPTRRRPTQRYCQCCQERSAWRNLNSSAWRIHPVRSRRTRKDKPARRIYTARRAAAHPAGFTMVSVKWRGEGWGNGAAGHAWTLTPRFHVNKQARKDIDWNNNPKTPKPLFPSKCSLNII